MYISVKVQRFTKVFLGHFIFLSLLYKHKLAKSLNTSVFRNGNRHKFGTKVVKKDGILYLIFTAFPSSVHMFRLLAHNHLIDHYSFRFSTWGSCWSGLIIILWDRWISGNLEVFSGCAELLTFSEDQNYLHFLP